MSIKTDVVKEAVLIGKVDIADAVLKEWQDCYDDLPNIENRNMEGKTNTEKGTHLRVKANFLRLSSINEELEIKNFDQELMDKFPTIKKFINSLSFKVGRVVLLELDKKSFIPVHHDGGDQYKEYWHKTARIHIPIRTNENVLFYNIDKQYNFKKNEMWCINNIKKHAVENRSEETRLHLVLDAYIDDEVKRLIDNGDYSIGKEMTEKYPKKRWNKNHDVE